MKLKHIIQLPLYFIQGCVHIIGALITTLSWGVFYPLLNSVSKATLAGEMIHNHFLKSVQETLQETLWTSMRQETFLKNFEDFIKAECISLDTELIKDERVLNSTTVSTILNKMDTGNPARAIVWLSLALHPEWREVCCLSLCKNPQDLQRYQLIEKLHQGQVLDSSEFSKLLEFVQPSLEDSPQEPKPLRELIDSTLKNMQALCEHIAPPTRLSVSIKRYVYQLIIGRSLAMTGFLIGIPYAVCALGWSVMIPIEGFFHVTFGAISIECSISTIWMVAAGMVFLLSCTLYTRRYQPYAQTFDHPFHKSDSDDSNLVVYLDPMSPADANKKLEHSPNMQYLPIIAWPPGMPALLKVQYYQAVLAAFIQNANDNQAPQTRTVIARCAQARHLRILSCLDPKKWFIKLIHPTGSPMEIYTRSTKPYTVLRSLKLNQREEGDALYTQRWWFMFKPPLEVRLTLDLEKLKTKQPVSIDGLNSWLGYLLRFKIQDGSKFQQIKRFYLSGRFNASKNKILTAYGQPGSNHKLLKHLEDHKGLLAWNLTFEDLEEAEQITGWCEHHDTLMRWLKNPNIQKINEEYGIQIECVDSSSTLEQSSKWNRALKALIVVIGLPFAMLLDVVMFLVVEGVIIPLLTLMNYMLFVKPGDAGFEFLSRLKSSSEVNHSKVYYLGEGLERQFDLKHRELPLEMSWVGRIFPELKTSSNFRLKVLSYIRPTVLPVMFGVMIWLGFSYLNLFPGAVFLGLPLTSPLWILINSGTLLLFNQMYDAYYLRPWRLISKSSQIEPVECVQLSAPLIQEPWAKWLFQTIENRGVLHVHVPKAHHEEVKRQQSEWSKSLESSSMNAGVLSL